MEKINRSDRHHPSKGPSPSEGLSRVSRSVKQLAKNQFVGIAMTHTAKPLKARVKVKPASPKKTEDKIAHFHPKH